MVWLPNVSARTVTRIEGVRLRAAEEREFPAERERSVVFQEHGALARRTAEKRGSTGVACAALPRRLALFEAGICELEV